MLIEWYCPERLTLYGYVDAPGYGLRENNGRVKYFLGPWKDASLVVDIFKTPSGQMDLDIPVDSVEAGKAWCQMVEDTGAY